MEVRQISYGDELKQASELLGVATPRATLCYILYDDSNQPIGIISFIKHYVESMAESIFGKNIPNVTDTMYKISLIKTVDPKNFGFLLNQALNMAQKRVGIRVVSMYTDESVNEDDLFSNEFKYYGKTEKKKDFYALDPNGKWILYKKPLAGIEGQYRDRPIYKKYAKICNIENSTAQETQQPPAKKPRHNKTVYPVIRISKDELFDRGYKNLADLMKQYRSLSESHGVKYDNSMVIGIKVWFDEDFIYQQNYAIDLKKQNRKLEV